MDNFSRLLRDFRRFARSAEDCLGMMNVTYVGDKHVVIEVRYQGRRLGSDRQFHPGWVLFHWDGCKWCHVVAYGNYDYYTSYVGAWSRALRDEREEQEAEQRRLAEIAEQRRQEAKARKVKAKLKSLGFTAKVQGASVQLTAEQFLAIAS